MNPIKIVTAICSLLFIMIGTDKFLNFLEPPCSLMSTISPTVWKLLGVMQLLAGVLIWIPKFKKGIAIFFTVFMLVFTIIHIANHTYDIGGSASMAVLLGILVWDSKSQSNKKK